MNQENQPNHSDRFPGENPPVVGFRPELYGFPAGIEAFALGDHGGVIETQCGAAWDAQDVERYDGTLGVTRRFVNDHQAPVGVIRWNNDLATRYTNAGNVNNERWCTGTLIGGNLFLTAGHCFDDADANSWRLPRINGTTTIIPPAEIARNMHIEFNYQRDAAGNLRPVQSIAVAELLEHRLGDLDYAIARLSGLPGNQFGVTAISATDAVLNDMLCIIGHPAGRPKQIEAGRATGFTTTRIQYNDIDTLGGNSGSGILHANRGSIIGVHTNGGCETDGTGFNVGVRISSLIGASPILNGIVSAGRMSLAQAMWTHGHSLRVEYSDRIQSIRRAGFYASIDGKPHTDNWFHFAIPTAVIVNDVRLRVGSVMLRFKTGSNNAFIHAVHIYDGENRIAAYDSLRLSPREWTFQRFDVPHHPESIWGLGISVGVSFRGANAAENRLEFSSAGCDFLR